MDYISDLLKKEFSQKKILIKKSKFFFNDKNDNIIFIYTIKNLNLFKNYKENINQIKTSGSLFKIPISLSWQKDLNNKTLYLTLKLKK